MYRFSWTYASWDPRLGSDFSRFRNLCVQVGTQPHCKKVSVTGQLARTINIYWSHTTANSILCISTRIKQRLGIVTIVHMGSVVADTGMQQLHDRRTEDSGRLGSCRSSWPGRRCRSTGEGPSVPSYGSECPALPRPTRLRGSGCLTGSSSSRTVKEGCKVLVHSDLLITDTEIGRWRSWRQRIH